MPISKLEVEWDIKKLALKFKTDESIAAECERAKRRSRVTGFGAVLSLLTCFLTTGSAELLTKIWPAMEMSPWVTGFVAIGLFCAIGMLVLTSMSFAMSEKTELLSPLASSDYCVEANDLVTRFADARKIRDSVLESGRQLYVFDYVEIARAARRSRPDNEDELRRASCASIHKLGIEG